MPILEFECKNCHQITEFLKLSKDEAEPEDCVKCSEGVGTLVKKFPSNTSFELKGRGWAKDRYSGK